MAARRYSGGLSHTQGEEKDRTSGHLPSEYVLVGFDNHGPCDAYLQLFCSFSFWDMWHYIISVFGFTVVSL